ncbi:MAG: polynucleotide adenylyltransferase PcnB [Gammaproteobacteria bacterium]
MNHTVPSTRHEGPVIVPRPDHNVSRSQISKNALRVLYRLKESGYKAFLVGGGVRDLLLGREPKDFDIVTDALPDDVRRLFRNSRLIGRRFRLAHVHFGREIIEVATFRASRDMEVDEQLDRKTDAGGRILRDNVYGDIDEDVWRRDFTCNALYYNIADFSIWDYAGGVQDILDGTMRLLGEPEERYREDPVRMLRAVRFAAKLGFRFDPATEAPLLRLGDLLSEVPAARLFDEWLKLFLSGHAVQSYELLRHYGLFRYLFPATDRALDQAENDSFRKLLLKALENTDDRVANGQPVTPMFLLGVFLWQPAERLATTLRESGDAPMQAMIEACDTVLRAQQQHVSIPRRFGTPMREMMVMQLRLRNQHGRRALRLVEHPRFRAAFDFLRLRVAAGDEAPEVFEFWERLESMDPEHRKAAVAPKRGERGPRRRSRRRKKKAT